MADYCILKLEGGDDVIGKYINEDEDFHYVDDVMKFEFNQSYSGTTVSMYRWIPFSDDKILPIKKDKVVVISKARASVVEYYEDCVSKYYAYVNGKIDTELNVHDISDEEYDAVVQLNCSNTSVH